MRRSPEVARSSEVDVPLSDTPVYCAYTYCASVVNHVEDVVVTFKPAVVGDTVGSCDGRGVGVGVGSVEGAGDGSATATTENPSVV